MLLTSSAFAWVGAILSTGEERWLYITFAASFMTSGFLAMFFKKPDETIRMVVGRCGLAILGGIFFTPLTAKYLEAKSLADDGIALAGFATLTCIISFILGVTLLRFVNSKSEEIINRLFVKWLGAEDDNKKP